MGMSATVYLISEEAYQAAHDGDLDSFDTSLDIDPIELDKAWHAIHYLITGDTELTLLKGGAEVVEEAYAHSPKLVAFIWKKIQEKTLEEFAASFSFDDFNKQEIYPNGWDETGYDYIENYLVSFLEFIELAVSRNEGLFIVIA